MKVFSAPKRAEAFFNFILILLLSSKVDRRPRTDIVRGKDSAGESGPNKAGLSLVLIYLFCIGSSLCLILIVNFYLSILPKLELTFLI